MPNLHTPYSNTLRYVDTATHHWLHCNVLLGDSHGKGIPNGVTIRSLSPPAMAQVQHYESVAPRKPCCACIIESRGKIDLYWHNQEGIWQC